MQDDNWELINGEAAHTIEVLNYSNQVNVIEALVHLLMHHHKGEDGGCESPPSIVVLKEFHRTATLFLLRNPGEFRDIEVTVGARGQPPVHIPPKIEDMINHLDAFFIQLQKNWTQKSPQELGALALWMLNWIHPFRNGNGRTARAFCYACISLRAGFVLPGSPTVIDLIMQNRIDYQHALKIADNAFETGGVPDLAPMTEFIDRLLAEQLKSVIA